jgi:hypothetical protein
VDEAGLGLFPVVGFCISDIEPLGSATTLLVNYSFFTFPIKEHKLG